MYAAAQRVVPEQIISRGKDEDRRDSSKAGGANYGMADRLNRSLDLNVVHHGASRKGRVIVRGKLVAVGLEQDHDPTGARTWRLHMACLPKAL